jgi:foldase protein PrsA
MRFKKWALLGMLALTVIMLSACGNNKEEATDEKKETDQKQEQPQDSTQKGEEKVVFPELDRKGLEADKIMASYENGEVTGEEFAKYLSYQGFMEPQYPINDPEFRKEALRYYIAEKTIGDNLTEKEKQNIKQKVEELWEQLKLKYDEKTRADAFKKLGITEEGLKQFLASYFSTEAYFKGQITQDELKAYYEEMQEELTTANVRHILIQTQERQPDGSFKEVRSDAEARKIADDLYDQLQKGADFAELAKQHSEDAGSKENGGLYEGASVAGWVPEFRTAALEQPLNEIGEPVKTDFGYHIIRVEERKVIPFDEIKEPLHGKLAAEKFEKYFTETLPGKIKEINL